jgi:hypothetical protein
VGDERLEGLGGGAGHCKKDKDCGSRLRGEKASQVCLLAGNSSNSFKRAHLAVHLSPVSFAVRVNFHMVVGYALRRHWATTGLQK